jgi:predicted Rossmann-fold nucleotide-binding protein
MYQFAYHAEKVGSKILGTIPFEQTSSQECLDFSKLKISACYITPGLQERMDAFRLSTVFIVGTTGTGTYEEILTILDDKEKLSERNFIIFNEDGFNAPLIALMNKNKCPNVFEVKNRAEFSQAIKTIQLALNTKYANTGGTKDKRQRYPGEFFGPCNYSPVPKTKNFQETDEPQWGFTS